jgi:asparagine synthase (glutamine-hydrolysing)
LIANAEVFNYKELAAKYNIELVSGSDCEIIIHLYKKLGIEKMLPLLDAEFAFVLYDEQKDRLFAARDHLGIRGMYYAHSADYREMAFASESKALTFMQKMQQFKPGHWWSSDAPTEYKQFYFHEYPIEDRKDEEYYLEGIKYYLEKAVEKRLMSERPVGCLLSGGLDSSLVSAIAAKYYSQADQIETFAIGLKGSPDIYNAKLVADHIGTKHHSVELSEKEFLAAIDDTIYTLGSFDVTTVRASVGHRLISQYVKNHSDVKVLFSGETADEFGSYLYFQNAPNPESFQTEAIRLLKDIHYFDMKRGDRSISSAGLEARVPFADKDFMHFYMGIHPRHRMFDENRIEKYLIRKAFESERLLPIEVLWRRKNGFSDSVSSKKKSWSTIIQEHINIKLSDAHFESGKSRFRHDTPAFKEAYYYRERFTEEYRHHQNLTPYQWLPKWCGDIKDPSARKLKIYQAD